MSRFVSELGNDTHILLGFSYCLQVHGLDIGTHEGRLVVKPVENGSLGGVEFVSLHQNTALEGICVCGIETGNDDIQTSFRRFLVVGNGGVEEDLRVVHNLEMAKLLATP